MPESSHQRACVARWYLCGNQSSGASRRRRDNLTHWLISTQAKRLKTEAKKGGAATKRKWEKATTKQKRDYADKQSELQGDNGLSPSQHTQFVKLVKVNSRRDFS